VILRDGQGAFARDTMLETAGMTGVATPMTQWPAARCSALACTITVERAGRSCQVLILRGRKDMPQADLAQACSRADIVIARQALDPSCRPALLMADGALLERSGGLSLDLRHGAITNVADQQGDHPWWRAHHPAF
jgi:competence protein ComEC